MELKKLVDETLKIFEIHSVEELGDALLKEISNRDKMKKFEEAVNNDLSVDWLKAIYQYYAADRKDKKQDFTPDCLAKLMGALVGQAEYVYDLCAGSGALTIQKWCQNPNQKFVLYEIDENVIPYLLYNLCLRNIDAEVLHADVLKDEIYEKWKIVKGEKYGKCISLESTV